MKVVPKGAGRPAAASKRNRHAQNTPLPPRAGQVEAARSATPAKPVRKAARSKREAIPDTPSATKARTFGARMPIGWSIRYKDLGGVTEATAVRGAEMIWISWTNGSLTLRPMPTYSCSGRTVTIRNASEAVRLAARPASEAEASAAQKQARRPAGRKAVPRTARRLLTFDPGTALDEEVVTALLGMRVEWANRFTDTPEVAWVPTAAHEIKIEADKHGDRQITFRCPATGYRTFRLSALRKVGGSAPRKVSRGKAKR